MNSTDKNKSALEKIAATLINDENLQDKEIFEVLSEENKKRIASKISDGNELINHLEVSKQKVLANITASKKQDSNIKPLSWLYIAASIVIFFWILSLYK